MSKTLLERVIEHEGFRSEPYQDTRGVWTIGHGLTYLTERESYGIVSDRLARDRVKLAFEEPWLNDLPPVITDVLVEMRFQMGVTGVYGFKRMWAALKEGDFDKAADEMLDSRWHEQTPNRAKALADLVRNARNAT